MCARARVRSLCLRQKIKWILLPSLKEVKLKLRPAQTLQHHVTPCCCCPCPGTTTWRCETAWTRAVSWWGSIAGRSPPLQSSPLEISSSSSLCPTMRPTEPAFPSDTRYLRQVGFVRWTLLLDVPVLKSVYKLCDAHFWGFFGVNDEEAGLFYQSESGMDLNHSTQCRCLIASWQGCFMFLPLSLWVCKTSDIVITSITFHLQWLSFTFYCWHLGLRLGEQYDKLALHLSVNKSLKNMFNPNTIWQLGKTCDNEPKKLLSNFMVCLCFSQSIRAFDYAIWQAICFIQNQWIIVPYAPWLEFFWSGVNYYAMSRGIIWAVSSDWTNVVSSVGLLSAASPQRGSEPTIITLTSWLLKKWVQSI